MKINKIERDKKGRFVKGKSSLNKLDLNCKKIISLYIEEGKSLVEISKIFNCSETPIRRILLENKIKLLGYKPWNRGKSKEDNFLLKKHSENLKKKYKSGEIKPYWKGKKSIHLKKRNLENNPMRNKLNIEKANISRRKLREKGNYKISSTIFGKGEKHPYFNNWASRRGYPEKFNLDLKIKIRKRDNYTCQECFKKQRDLNGLRLQVHHIDFNKENNSPFNLITLCSKCHLLTNKNRKHWEEHFKMKIFIKELFNPNKIIIKNEIK